MKIIVSQQDKKILIEFHHGKIVDNYSVDKADEFINILDRFIRKRKISFALLKKAVLEFVNTGVLTERVIRSIIIGLRFWNPP